MSSLTFGGDIAALQRTLAECHDMVLRRAAVLQALDPRTGERVLEVGCGGGVYAFEVGRCVGATGRVSAIDISADQIAAATARCAELAWVECRVADATDLPYASGEFDAVYSNQVLEYVAELDRALAEVARVLRPGGRFLNVATNWSSLVWHSSDPGRMGRILSAWASHAPYTDLPAMLAERLRSAGLEPARRTAVPVLNTSYHPNSFSYWGARLIGAYVVGCGLIPAAEADAWLSDLDELERRGASFLSSTPILTEAVRLT